MVSSVNLMMELELWPVAVMGIELVEQEAEYSFDVLMVIE